MPIWDDEQDLPTGQAQSIAQRVRAGAALPILSNAALFDLALFGYETLRCFYAQQIKYPFPQLPGPAQLANLPFKTYLTISPVTFIEDALRWAGKEPAAVTPVIERRVRHGPQQAWLLHSDQPGGARSPDGYQAAGDPGARLGPGAAGGDPALPRP